MNEQRLPGDIYQPYDRAVEELVWQGLLTPEEAHTLTQTPRSVSEHS